MNHCNDVDLIRSKTVNDSIGMLHNFSHVVLIVFRNAGARLWKHATLLDATSDTIKHCLGIPRRVAGDVSMDCRKMRLRSFRPNQLHGDSPKLLRTES